MQTLTPHWDQIQHNPNPTDYGGNEQISLETTLLIALWVFATPDSYRSVGERFNVGKSTVYKSNKRSICLINLYLCPRFIKWSSLEEWQIISTNFELKTRFPQIIGCIDGCHPYVVRYKMEVIMYYNRKKYIL
jgi:hypothetical protein